MHNIPIHTLILGAGPAGLAAGYTLSKAGVEAVVLERDKVAGGLMRSVKRGDFVVDIGRKELYNRLEKVDRFWEDLLGSNYRLYPHRGGILYQGQILEYSPAYRGFRRGLTWGSFISCSLEFLGTRLKRQAAKPRNVEEFFYQTRGRQLTRIFSQGFQEKLTGTRWADTPLPEVANSVDGGFIQTVSKAFKRTFSASEPNTYKGIWRHPAKGTGQICELLEEGMTKAGGKIRFETRLVGMTTTANKVETVTATIGSETLVFQPQNVISSIPLEMLTQFLTSRRFDETSAGPKDPHFRKKTVVLVYLFFDEPPKFPHAWLNVTCPDTRIGRITNYAAQNGDMVPPGKTCLCCEFYCFGDDPILLKDNKEFTELALSECEKFRLATRSKCFDNLVLRLPGADASQNRHNWLSKIRLGLMNEILPFKNLFYVNRTDLDIATLAGIEAAEAILSGDRTTFDRHIDPREIGIRSEKKPFEFKNPAA
jgi:protoporphyrinogen oxidase